MSDKGSSLVEWRWRERGREREREVRLTAQG